MSSKYLLKNFKILNLEILKIQPRPSENNQKKARQPDSLQKLWSKNNQIYKKSLISLNIILKVLPLQHRETLVCVKEEANVKPVTHIEHQTWLIIKDDQVTNQHDLIWGVCETLSHPKIRLVILK